MPLPADVLKTVLALEELHDFTRMFTTTEGEATVNFLLKRRLHKRLRHVKVKYEQPLSFAIASTTFMGTDAGVGDVSHGSLHTGHK